MPLRIPARISWAVVLGLLANFAAQGQTRTDSGLAQLSIEELLNVQVLSATKVKAMSTRRSPGVVRVFTRQDIERYGFVTLRDVLATVPGAQIQEYRIGHQAVWMRGIKERYNNKILWLIDGVPIRDSYYGHTNIDEVLPLHMVERIEILNGPGGVLYGSNAFSGVVSITTKREGRSMRFNSGSFQTVGGAVEFSAPGIYVATDQQIIGVTPGEGSRDGHLFTARPDAFAVSEKRPGQPGERGVPARIFHTNTQIATPAIEIKCTGLKDGLAPA